MSIAMILALVLATAPSLRARPVPAIVPLAEIRPGMEGYGIGPVNGTARGRFSFKVVSVARTGSDPYPLIVVELFVFGTHRSEPGLVIAGMSGSPLFVGNRLLGAISRAPTFPLDSKGYVLPAELMATFRPLALSESEPFLEPGSAQQWKPGESYVYCSVWGDVNRCAGATITTTGTDGLVVAQGHLTASWDNGDGSKNDKWKVATGPQAMPVWKARVYGKIPMMHFSTVIAGPRGPVAGVIIWNGEYGHIIRPDRRPLSIPISATVTGSRAQAVRRTFRVSYSPESVTGIMGSLKGIALLEFGGTRPLMLRATVRIRGIAEPFHIQEAFINWDVASKDEEGGALDRVLRWALLWTYPRAIVESVDAEVFPATAELYEPQSYRATVGADSALSIQVNIRRERDYTMFTKTVSVNQVEGASAYVLVTGGWIQKVTLSMLPLAQAVVALKAVDDASALYLVATTTTPGAVKESAFSPEGWAPETDRMDVHILAKVTGAGVVLVVKDDEPLKVEFAQ